MNVRLSSNTMNEAKVEELLKILAIQKKLSKLDISYYGDSIMKTGFIYLNKNIASCQNLSDLRVCFVPSSQNPPFVIMNQFFSELSRLTELKGLTLFFSRRINTDREFFELVTQCFKNLKNLQTLILYFESYSNIKNEDMQIMAKQLSEFDELSHLTLNLEGALQDGNINTAFEDISTSVQTLKNLKSFDINLDHCRQTDGKILNSSIHKISTHTSLTSLTLNFGKIDVPDSFIMLGNLNQLKSLDLKFDSLSNGEINSISKALSCLKGLELLKLHIYGSKVADTRAYGLADALTSTTKLKSLTIKFSDVKFLTDNFCDYLKEPLSKLQRLEYLDLQFPSSQLIDEGIAEVATALGSLRKLLSLKLDFYKCENEDESLEAIGNAILKMNQIKLLSLTFYESLVTSQGIFYIGRVISKLHGLEDLSLSFGYCKDIEDNSVKRLYQRLEGLKRLQTLYLDFEGSGDELIKKLLTH